MVDIKNKKIVWIFSNRNGFGCERCGEPIIGTYGPAYEASSRGPTLERRAQEDQQREAESSRKRPG